MILQGTYKKTINKDLCTGHTLFEIFTTDGFTVKCAGICPYYPKGMPLELSGNMDENHIFISENITECGDNVKLTKKYFASQLFGKMSAVCAANLAILTGDDLFGFMDREDATDRIMLATKKDREWAERIVRIVRETSIQRALLDMISEAGGTIGDMNAVYRKFGKSSIIVMKKNPYALMSVKGISFTKCDRIAKKYGFEPDNHDRIKALMESAMKSVYSQGSTRTTWKKLWNKIRYQIRNSAYPDDPLSRLYFLQILFLDKRYMVHGGYIYEYHMYKKELSIARDIVRLIKNRTHYHIFPDDISFVEESLHVTYDRSQRKIFDIADAGVAVLTGPPGSGKTSTIQGFLQAMRMKKPGIRIMLGATTGCAARHFADTTDMTAETVQRMLVPCAETNQFLYNRFHPLDADIIIIDECSMADTKTASQFFEAVRNGTFVLWVGDVDQLKSVGPGKVLKDMIQCGKIPVVRLETIHRQDKGSLIPENAYRVNHGILPLQSDETSCTFYQAENDQHAFDIMRWTIDEKLKGKSVTEYCLLSIIKKGVSGVNNLNDYMYQQLFESVPYFRYGAYKFSKNERIMMTDNNHKLQYCNGDIGTVLDYDAEGINIRLDHGEEIYISGEHLDNMVPAYAKTVHKAQGSENDNVVLILSDSVPSMLNREILYTGMTRAKSHLWVIFTGDAVVRCVLNENTQERNTGLCEMLQEYIA